MMWGDTDKQIVELAEEKSIDQISRTDITI